MARIQVNPQDICTVHQVEERGRPVNYTHVDRISSPPGVDKGDFFYRGNKKKVSMNLWMNATSTEITEGRNFQCNRLFRKGYPSSGRRRKAPTKRQVNPAEVFLKKLSSSNQNISGKNAVRAFQLAQTHPEHKKELYALVDKSFSRQIENLQNILEEGVSPQEEMNTYSPMISKLSSFNKRHPGTLSTSTRQKLHRIMEKLTQGEYRK